MCFLVGESIVDDSLQGVTSATDATDLPVAGRQPVGVTEEPVAFMTRAEVNTILRKGKGKAFTSIIALDLKLSYPTKIVTKLYPAMFIIPSQKFDESKGNTREHICSSELHESIL